MTRSLHKQKLALHADESDSTGMKPAECCTSATAVRCRKAEVCLKHLMLPRPCDLRFQTLMLQNTALATKKWSRVRRNPAPVMKNYLDTADAKATTFSRNEHLRSTKSVQNHEKVLFRTRSVRVRLPSCCSVAESVGRFVFLSQRACVAVCQVPVHTALNQRRKR